MPLHRDAFAGYAGRWNYSGGLSRIDNIRISDKNRFYRIARFLIRRCAYFNRFRYNRDDLARKNYDSGLCLARRVNILFIPGL